MDILVHSHLSLILWHWVIWASGFPLQNDIEMHGRIRTWTPNLLHDDQPVHSPYPSEKFRIDQFFQSGQFWPNLLYLDCMDQRRRQWSQTFLLYTQHSRWPADTAAAGDGSLIRRLRCSRCTRSSKTNYLWIKITTKWKFDQKGKFQRLHSYLRRNERCTGGLLWHGSSRADHCRTASDYYTDDPWTDCRYRRRRCRMSTNSNGSNRRRWLGILSKQKKVSTVWKQCPTLFSYGNFRNFRQNFWRKIFLRSSTY